MILTLSYPFQISGHYKHGTLDPAIKPRGDGSRIRSSYRGLIAGSRKYPKTWRKCTFPFLYLITPALHEIYPGLSFKDACARFLIDLEKRFINGTRLIQLRQKELSSSKYRMLAERVVALATAHGVQVLFNRHIELAKRLQASGVHLPTSDWMRRTKRPLPPPFLVGVSCHNLTELQLIRKLDPDFAVLSPITPSASHPNTPPLGWYEFAEVIKHTQTPIFALGGLTPAHLSHVHRLGGYGVAAIRGLWEF